MKRSIGLLGSALAMSIGAATATSVAANPSSSQSAPAHAQVATFAIANMTCPTCPITVKAAMSAVHGVRSVKVDLNSKTATVEFDPKLTSAAAIAAASTNAGFPAKSKG